MKSILLTVLMSIYLFGNDNNISIFKSLIDDVVKIVNTEKNSSSRAKKIVIETNQTKPQTQEEKELLKKMGIVVENGKIEIDANKTKSFFERINKALEKGLNEGVKKASKEAPKEDEIGIKVEGQKIEIDLNQTANFMKKWIKAMGVFAKELNSSLKSIEK